jgi:hypothetical protein
VCSSDLPKQLPLTVVQAQTLPEAMEALELT